MEFPVEIPVLSVEYKKPVLSDTEPTPETGWEIVLIKDLGYTKIWQEYRVV